MFYPEPSQKAGGRFADPKYIITETESDIACSHDRTFSQSLRLLKAFSTTICLHAFLMMHAKYNGQSRRRKLGIATELSFWWLGESDAQGQNGLTRRLLTIRVEVNDATGLFLVDTGSDLTIIDSAFSQGLGSSETIQPRSM